MGYNIGTEIAQADKLTLEQKLSWQLQANHYPPVSEDFIPVAMEAIELAERNEWDTIQEYPNGLQRTVSFTILGLHLQPFISNLPIPEDEKDKEEEDEE